MTKKGKDKMARLDHKSVAELLRAAVGAFNSHDSQAFAALMSEDVVLEHSAAASVISGRAEVEAFYAGLWRSLPDMMIELADGPFFHPNAPRVSLRWRVLGAQPGDLDARSAEGDARSGLDAREILELRDGLISRVQVLMNMADFVPARRPSRDR